MYHEIKEWIGNRKDQIKTAAVSVGTALIVGAFFVLKEKYDIQRIIAAATKAILRVDEIMDEHEDRRDCEFQ